MSSVAEKKRKEQSEIPGVGKTLEREWLPTPEYQYLKDPLPNQFLPSGGTLTTVENAIGDVIATHFLSHLTHSIPTSSEIVLVYSAKE